MWLIDVINSFSDDRFWKIDFDGLTNDDINKADAYICMFYCSQFSPKHTTGTLRLTHDGNIQHILWIKSRMYFSHCQLKVWSIFPTVN